MSGDPRLVLDFPDRRGLPRRFVFAGAREAFVARTVDEVRDVIEAADRAAHRGSWVPGFVAYDAAPAFDAAMRVRAGYDGPLAWFAAFDEPTSRSGSDPDLPHWRIDADRAAHEAAVDEIQRAIDRGDVYQVNHTVRLVGDLPGDTMALYERLRAAQRPRYAACLDLGDLVILSASPELFFSRRGRSVHSRPMKGTAPRGRWSAEDEAIAAALRSSHKERAENVMIVDLIRNDLGRVAVPGSVLTTELFTAERYPTVWQLTSTVAATLREGVGLVDLFSALFPCGSVTGAPKIAAMSFIASLESTPRGVYCGAVGLVHPGGDCDFNVAIRTLVVDRPRGRAEFGAGGGITHDSRAGAEYDELVTKARILTESPPEPEGLIETLRFDGSRYVRLEGHLARLAASVEYFCFDASVVVRARQALASTAGQMTGVRRVRLEARHGGAVTVTHAPLASDAVNPSKAMRVELAAVPVRSDDVRLHHKTSDRAIYDSVRASRPGADDVILWNERGEVTETTIGNLVAEIDGERVTPPRECGLLGGVFRESLIARGEVRERVVRVEDLARAARLWMVNSLREWVPITVTHPGSAGPPRRAAPAR